MKYFVQKKKGKVRTMIEPNREFGDSKDTQNEE